MAVINSRWLSLNNCLDLGLFTELLDVSSSDQLNELVCGDQIVHENDLVFIGWCVIRADTLQRLIDILDSHSNLF